MTTPPAAVPTVPASSGQERLWLVAQADPEDCAYLVPVGWRLAENVSPHRLRAALDALVRRHEALRTGLVLLDGRLVQEVRPDVPVPLVELGPVSPNELAEALRSAARTPMDLSVPPLLRCLHGRLPGGGTGIGLVLHHAICDSWSLEQLRRDLLALLAGRSPEGEAGRWTRFADEERSWAAGPAADVDRSYWRGRDLAGTPSLRLGRRPDERGRRRAGAVHRFAVPLADVDALTRSCRASRSAVLLAAFAGLLHRYSVNERVNVALPVSGRPPGEPERTVGYFSNTVVVTAEIDRTTTVRQVVAAALEQVTGALEHGRLPFQEVVRLSGAPRDLDPPLYQAMFGPQDTPGSGPGPERVRVHNGTAKCDLTLLVEVDGDHVECELEHDTAVADAGWAARFCAAYGRLLAAAADAPETPVDRLLVVAPSAVGAALADRPDAVDHRGGPSAHEIVAGQVRSDPDAVAVRWPGGTLSRRELDRRANAYAARLAGLGSRGRVGLLLDRGPDLVVAVLGAMKAGWAFVPLDRRLPAARIAAVCADARVGAVATVDPLPAGLDVPVPPLDDSGPDAGPEVAVGGGDLAFVYYTSGSTGRPKGVPTDHACLMTRLAHLRDAYPLGPGDAVLHKTPIIFDIALWEIFLPLFAGGTVEVLPAGTETDSARVAAAIRSRPVALVHFVPSALAAYLDAGPPADAARLRWVAVSGEAVPAGLVRRARGHFGVPVHVQYGQTETAEVAIWDGTDPAPAGATLLGRPAGAFSLHVVDPDLNPVPADVPGELCVAGPGGLAWGYLGRSRETAQRFVPHPAPTEPGQRLYRTGDLARVSGSGLVEYLGRVDRQLKIRGCRVEPGEVEQVLSARPDVADCVVVARPAQDGQDQLVAYVLPAAGTAPTPTALAAHARDRLPWFMVPAAYVILAGLPATMSGKVDRDRLPAYGREAYPLDPAAGEPPRGELEGFLAGEWEALLGVEAPGRDDDFFRSGGSSLAAARLVAAIGDRFGLRLPLGGFLARPTIAALAAAVEDGVSAQVIALSEAEIAELRGARHGDDPR